ncbi:MAG TPA: hypothetical protein VKF14_12515 [Candidatus Dormibacteraeota bacterium]|nr:hypothetical protein [Candidatus Dormibacteraeota bacterium]
MATTSELDQLLDQHLGLDLHCLDRIYLNAYVPSVQVGGQVVTFLTRHLGYPTPSPFSAE